MSAGQEEVEALPLGPVPEAPSQFSCADLRLRKRGRSDENTAVTKNAQDPEHVDTPTHLSLAEHETAMEDKIAQLSRQHRKELREIQADHGAARAAMASSHKEKLRRLEDAAQAETAAAVARIRAKHAQQVEDIKQKHAAALAEATQVAEKRSANGKQFTYAVRGSSEAHLRGSVPHSIFDAEPDSVLAQMYNGEWEYPQDKKGRALVNSNPAHWLQILDWLSFGIAPANPSPEFIQQCRFWQLTNLLAVIDQPSQPAAIPDPLADTIIISKPGDHDLTIHCSSQDCRARFTADIYICHFDERHSGEVKLDPIAFSVFGQQWKLRMKYYHTTLCSDSVPDPVLRKFSVHMTAGRNGGVPVLDLKNTDADGLEHECYHRNILGDEFFRPPFLDGRGGIFITLTVIYP